MGAHPGPSPARRRTALLLILMAGSILAISYCLELGDRPRPGAHPSLLVSLDAPADAGAPMRSTGPGSPPPAAELAARDGAAAASLGRPARWLSGRVLDAGGRPIPGVEVTLGEQRTSTDAGGEFRLLQGSDDLLLRHSDFFPRVIGLSARRSLELSSGEPSQSRLLLAMFPGGRIRGRVMSPDGRPLKGVEVRFLDAAGRQPTPSPGPAVTAADGAYSSPLLRPGAHRLLFRHPDYQGTEAVITLEAGELEARGDAALRPGEPLHIQVLDSGGASLPDAGVWLLPPVADPGAPPLYLGATGDHGFLDARRDPRLHQRLRVLLAGYRRLEAPIDGARIELRLEPAPALAGTAIRRRTGLPVDLTAIRLEVETPEGFQPCPGNGVLFHPLERGKFLAGLPPVAGTYRVFIQAAGDLQGFSDPAAFDGESAPPACTVRLEPRGSLEGVVLLEDRPLGGALVEIYRDAALPAEIPAPEEEAASLRFAGGIPLDARAGPLRAQVTGNNGRFRFDELPDDNYRIRATHPRLAELYSPPIDIPAPGPMPLSMSRGGSLRGAVRGPTGEPEAGIPLILLREGFPFPRLSESDASGMYEFQNLFPGTYHLIIGESAAAAEEAVAAWAPPLPGSGPRGSDREAIRISAGGEENLDVRLVDLSWGWIQGRITVDGSPLAGAVLSVRGQPAAAAASPGAPPGGEAAPVERLAFTDSSGSFRVFRLAPGTYRLWSEDPPIDWLAAVEGGRKTPCAADLHTYSFSARLLRRRPGSPAIAAGEIRLEATGRLIHRGDFIDGALPPLRLFPGNYRLRVEAAGFLPLQERFAVQDRGIDLSLELTPAIRIRIQSSDGSEAGNAASQLPRGPTEVVLRRSGEEIYHATAMVEDEVLIPELAPGIYELELRSSRGVVRSRFEVLRAAK